MFKRNTMFRRHLADGGFQILTTTGWKTIPATAINSNQKEDQQGEFMRSMGFGGYHELEKNLGSGEFVRRYLSGKYDKLDKGKFKQMLNTGQDI